MYNSGFHENVVLNNGNKYNAFFLSIPRGTLPGFPFIVEVTSKTSITITIEGVMHEEKRGSWKLLPFINGKKKVI